MSDQFISAITDEAMTRVCYNGGWNLKPFKFFVSQSDIFDGSGDRAPWPYKTQWDEGSEETRQALKEFAFEYLRTAVTKEMQNDYTSGNCWYNARFSSVSKTNDITLCHHLNIPGDVAIDTPSKYIKTIYFVYQDNNGEDFLYAVARANGALIFETGITQSFFFNFTVANNISQEMTEFILNYSCAHEIEDHNTNFGDHIHSNLVARDGSRNISGILEYTGITANDFTKGNQIISKDYVDQYIIDYILPLINNTICPPGMMMDWPGSTANIPSGWAIRNGQQIKIVDNPKLYALLGTRFNQGNEAVGYFRLMNDNGLITKYNTSSSGAYQAENCDVYVSLTVPHSGWPCLGGHSFATQGLLMAASGRVEDKEYLESIGATVGNQIISTSTKGTNVWPTNRQYIPLIRLG